MRMKKCTHGEIIGCSTWNDAPLSSDASTNKGARNSRSDGI